MSKISNIIPITDLRQDATTLLKQVTSSQKSLVFTQRGWAVSVMVSMEAYEQCQHKLDLLRLLACGEKESEIG